MKPALALVLAAALSAAASAQAPTPQPAADLVISGWRLECNSRVGPLSCQVLDEITVRASNAVLSAISVRQPSGAKNPTIAVQIPLGIAIEDGVRVGFENGALQRLAIATCNRNGCFAQASLGDPLLAAMRSSKLPLRIAYENLDAAGAKQTVTITLGLDGFATAYAKLRTS